MLENDFEYEKMGRAETTHWWYQNLHELTLDTLKKKFNNKEIKIIDAGSGTGGLLLKLKTEGYTNSEGFDLSEFAVAKSKEKSLQVKTGNILSIESLFSPHYADVIICHDVLYFVDEKTLPDLVNSFHSILKPGGVLIANVPAYNAFRGSHDLAVGINERFNKNKLLSYFSPPFKIDLLCWPFLLSPLIYMIRLYQRLKFGKIKTESDVAEVNPFLNRILFNICRLERRFLKHTPWGSSIFMVAKKN